jgi:hypothetical protein
MKSIHRDTGFLFSRETLMTTLLVIACVVIAIGLFLAGAMWRARVTVQPRPPVSSAT